MDRFLYHKPSNLLTNFDEEPVRFTRHDLIPDMKSGEPINESKYSKLPQLLRKKVSYFRIQSKSDDSCLSQLHKVLSCCCTIEITGY